jgi:CheY-like chemotaxis protein
VTTAAVSEGETVVRFEVSDTGDGMRAEQLGRIFQPFVQGDTSTSRKYGGSGLGLTISSQLVGLMGGECGVASRLGEGSEFWFTIRVRADPSQPTHPLLGDAGLAGLSVLAVDNSATQLGVLSTYLTAWGMSVKTAESGEAALAALRESAAHGRPFDVALLEQSTAEAGGLDLQGEIVANPDLAAHLVIMLDLGQEEPGVHPVLFKPVHVEDLRRCLRAAVGLEKAEATVAEAERSLATGSPASGHLLVAEDNLVNQKVAVAMLSSAGYLVDTVMDGAEAVAATCRTHYDAILMDCQMPVMNGYEATAAIRANERQGPRTPIIAVTAGAGAKDHDRCIAAGMDGYTAKPVRKDALLALVAKHVTADPGAGERFDEKTLEGDMVDGLVPE